MFVVFQYILDPAISAANKVPRVLTGAVPAKKVPSGEGLLPLAIGPNTDNGNGLCEEYGPGAPGLIGYAKQCIL